MNEFGRLSILIPFIVLPCAGRYFIYVISPLAGVSFLLEEKVLNKSFISAGMLTTKLLLPAERSGQVSFEKSEQLFSFLWDFRPRILQLKQLWKSKCQTPPAAGILLRCSGGGANLFLLDLWRQRAISLAVTSPARPPRCSLWHAGCWLMMPWGPPRAAHITFSSCCR